MNTKIRIISLLFVFALLTALPVFAQSLADKSRARGEEKLNQGDYLGAESAFTSCIDLSPGDDKCYAQRAVTYQILKKYEQAMSDINKAIALKSIAAYYYFRASILTSRGSDAEEKVKDSGKADYDKAFTDLNAVITNAPNFEDAYPLRGNLYKYLKKYDFAYSDYLKAYELSPKNREYFLNVNVAENFITDFKPVVAGYDKEISLHPADGALYFIRGHLYFDQLKDINSALKDFTKAVELDPTNTIYYQYRARFYSITGKPELALADYGKAIAIEPNTAELYTGRGQVYSGIYQKFSADDESKAEARAKARQNAIADFKKALQLDPKDADAQNLLEILESANY